MVAIQTAAGVAGGIVVYKLASEFDAHPDPRIDAGIKGAVGLVALLGSIKVDGWAKTGLIAVGVGASGAALEEFNPFQ